MKHVTIVRQDARDQSDIKIYHQISHSRATPSIETRLMNDSSRCLSDIVAKPHHAGEAYIIFATITDLKMIRHRQVQKVDGQGHKVK